MKNRIVRFYYRTKGRLLGIIQEKYGRPLFKNEKTFISLKNKYKNQRVFVIGNGPSLNEMNLKHLKNEITIGCNGLFLKFDEMGFAPAFYTVEDNLVAEDRRNIINNLQNTIKILPYDLRYCLKPDKNTIFINFIRNYPGFPDFSFDCENMVYWGGTVTYLNIQLACYLGAKEIYLIGIDHDYTIPEKDICVDGAVIESKSYDQNHFHPDYFGPGFRYHDPRVDRMEMAYKKAKTALKKHNIKIFNAGVGGKLRIFDRIDYDSLF
ncbi:6-hydroxymethylpterin diphosphokinase MptE-like protein [Desulfobacula toluolica]|uniref:Conserved uncharacterized protein n=1 Tax=Desulfobacula toluolica (strain DSM 7467 / Tol2) TaxID=651182 RepID=K0N8Q9_DESTT|nr:6-hydroxymethylpterin diphosphokinase MptE-like protein [Desulfobacula toluolica]CCK80304.1 conserved uncharacterized protein [Desulfobacula toluolica Tol2]